MKLEDKNGKEIELSTILNYLTGTNENDESNSVIDFSLYKIDDKRSITDSAFYLVASDAIVTQISFIGPFVMLEVDFRNIGIPILQQVMNAINKFHKDINTDNVLMMSTITPMNRDATHLMTLANPLMCIRGYSEEGSGSTILQLVYSVDNIGFIINDIDYDKIDMEVDHEIRELESYEISNEAVTAAEETLEDNVNNEMKEMFHPEFGLRISEHHNDKKIRISGQASKIEKENSNQE